MSQRGATAYQWQVLLGLLAATEKAVPLGKATFSRILVPTTSMLGFRPIHVPAVCGDNTRNGRRADLVDAATQCSPGDSNSATGTTAAHPHGRITGRMGRTPGRDGGENSGKMATIPKSTPYQLVRDEGNSSSSSTLVHQPSEPYGIDRVRQLYDSVIPEQARGDAVKTVVEG